MKKILIRLGSHKLMPQDYGLEFELHIKGRRHGRGFTKGRAKLLTVRNLQRLYLHIKENK